ncbi:hypothetical protein R1flu_006066 [Riccia fluitans]|uniref:Uncharacterized protein n=1 Tax=Riccia fluitans TaxID=41844 RepID=A0ABD1YY05_9MARC
MASTCITNSQSRNESSASISRLRRIKRNLFCTGGKQIICRVSVLLKSVALFRVGYCIPGPLETESFGVFSGGRV